MNFVEGLQADGAGVSGGLPSCLLLTVGGRLGLRGFGTGATGTSVFSAGTGADVGGFGAVGGRWWSGTGSLSPTWPGRAGAVGTGAEGLVGNEVGGSVLMDSLATAEGAAVG